VEREGDIAKGIFAKDETRAHTKLTPLGHKYSIFVKTLKLSLFLTSVVIFGVMVSYLSGTDETSILKNTNIADSEKPVPGQTEVERAKYEGVDTEGNPYTITADKASRSTERDDGVLFDNPVTDIELNDKSWLALKAAGGFFNRFAENIMLEDNVVAYHDSGYEIDMKNIVINLKERSGSTASPVTVQGPMGFASAQNMEVMPGAEKVILGGPIHIKIFDLSFIKG